MVYIKGVFFRFVCLKWYLYPWVRLAFGVQGIYCLGERLDGEGDVRACVRIYSVALSCAFHGSVVFDR